MLSPVDTGQLIGIVVFALMGIVFHLLQEDTPTAVPTAIPEWDRCFDATALEVVDEKLIPVFQMTYTTPNDIVVYGIFHVDQTIVVLAPHGGLGYYPANEVITENDYPVKRIFKYPSRTYHCKAVEAAEATTTIPATTGPYRGKDAKEFCDEVERQAVTMYGMADSTLQQLQQSVDKKESNEVRNMIRKEFSNQFIKCCSHTATDMHEELLFRLKPTITSQDERLFSEMEWESRHNPTGIVLSTVEDISRYMKSLCGQLVK